MVGHSFWKGEEGNFPNQGRFGERFFAFLTILQSFLEIGNGRRTRGRGRKGVSTAQKSFKNILEIKK